MSLPSSSDGGFRGKPQPDIYTILLALALVALVIGCVLLYVEQKGYSGSAMLVPATGSLESNGEVRVVQWTGRSREGSAAPCSLASISNRAFALETQFGRAS